MVSNYSRNSSLLNNIIQTLLPQPAQQSTLTEAQKLEQLQRQLVITTQSSYRQLCQIQKQGIDLFWHNRDGHTPQQVADAAGINGASMLAFHGALTDLIVGVATQAGVAPDIKLPTNAFTIAPTGIVTVLETPYTP